MEDDPSMISNASTNVSGEASDANSCSYGNQIKRQRLRGTIPAVRFKGVVAQQNGHWGAQIYANQKRIWLGTFESEKEAAMAYDSAAIKLRSSDSYRNFPWTNVTVEEPNFQSKYNVEEIVNMIKDGSYPSKFSDYLRKQEQRGNTETDRNLVLLHTGGEFLCKQLFQKELTPSDVGRLNRLVIPKKYALKYFPHISDAEQNAAGTELGNMQLVFFDKSMRSWKFRYCYWKSSQSFVFTKGWTRFVKEKLLKSKDMLVFSECVSSGKLRNAQPIFIIDIRYCEEKKSSNDLTGDGKEEDVETLQLGLVENINVDDHEDKDEFEEDNPQVGLGFNIVVDQNETKPGEEKGNLGGGTPGVEEEPEEVKDLPGAAAGKMSLRLFGVQII